MEGWLPLLGSVFLLSTLMLFVLRSERRDTILERFHLRKRRDSGSKTPPRSLSPEKRRTQSISTTNYSNAFPPSRCSALAQTVSSSALVEAVSTLRPDWIKRMLPIQESYLDASDDTYTPCGFSIQEIKALGDFPDYATLSGVSLPRPCYHFDLKKALPRPYRPIRWAYHQTMCNTTRPVSQIIHTDQHQHSPSWRRTGG